MITTYVINKISLSCKKEFYCNDCKKKQNLLIFFIFQGIRQTGTGVGPDKTPFDGSPYPVDAGGDGREVGTLIFLFDEVTQAGEGSRGGVVIKVLFLNLAKMRPDMRMSISIKPSSLIDCL